MADLAGKYIKGYELLERISAGGFGAVYRSYQSTLGREVAVKVILPGYANKPSFIRRFEMEAQLVARLEHLHIVPLYDFWRDPTGAYLVMRWMRGGDLKQALEEGPFDLGPAVLLLDQVAAGLTAAHSQGVTHCDLKPSNILLDEEGNAYLGDFSIAQILRSADNGPLIEDDDPDSIYGISPEQIRGNPATPLTDIYSLGVLLYQILTGEYPYPGMPAVQRLYKHISDPVPKIDKFENEIQEEINQIIQKATAKDPKQRYQSAIEMATAFRLATQANGNLALPSEALTPREDDILERIVAGLSNREIAQELFVEVSTVKWYITQIYRKLGVRSRKQAIARMQEVSLITESEVGESVVQSDEVALVEPTNPYKGLRAFDVSDARDFFGREELVEKLTGLLALAPKAGNFLPGKLDPGDGRFLTIIGPSGSGKSSLVKAGLIPALRGGDVPGSEKWFTVQLIPGRRPLDQLEIALARVAAEQSGNLRKHLERDAFGLLRVAELILPQNESELLVVIDQFEEVFTLVEDESKRAHFLALLAEAGRDPHSRVRIILTMRADYYDRPLHYREFGNLLRNHMETILPLSTTGLKRAILRPAEQAGVGFEPGLVDKIIEDIQYESGALPLLQYALTELFEEREDRMLTHAAYQRIGGSTGALVRRAEELYQEQEADGQEAIRQLFLRLVTLNDDAAAFPDIRQRVPRSELTSVVADNDLMDELVDTYAAYRLLTLDHDPESRGPTIEVAHEALLREWRRLSDWLDESRDDLRQRRQLTRSAEEWRQSNADRSFLLRGTRLDQFTAWSEKTEISLTAVEREYLAASVAWRDERATVRAAHQEQEAKLERRARRVLYGLVMVFFMAVVISGWFALIANRERTEAKRNFARSESQRLAAEANNVLQLGGSAEVAALLALRALDAHYTPQADLVLQKANAEHVDSTLIDEPDFDIREIGAFEPLVSPDNRYLRFRRSDENGYLNQVFEMWDMQTMEPLWQAHDIPLLGHPWAIRDFTADYSSVILAIRTDDIELAQLDANTGKPIRSFTGTTSPLVTFQLSEDGTTLVAGTRDGTIYVWDTENGEEVQRFSMGGGRYSQYRGHELFVAVSPDSQLVAAKAQGETLVWDIKSGQQLYRFENDDEVRSPPQFADGGRLLMTSELPNLSLWDLNTGKEVKNNIRSNQIVGFDLNTKMGERWLSPDGRLYAQGLVGLRGEDVVLWKVATGKILHRLTGHEAGAVPVDFTSDSQRLVTRGTDGTARVWDVASGQELLVVAGDTFPIDGADLSIDDRFLVTASGDYAVRIWDLEAPLHREENQLENVHEALYPSPDGRVALAADPEADSTVLAEMGSFRVLHHLQFTLDQAGPAFSSDGQMIVGVKDQQTVLVYDVASGELLGEHSNPEGAYRFAAFVPGTTSIFVGGDHGAYLLEAESGEQLRVFRTSSSGLNGANSGFVTVSPDGRYGALHVWAEDSKNVVYLWDLQTGALKFQSTPKPNDVVADFDFSDDSRYFAWGGSNKTAYVLDLQREEVVVSLTHLNPILGIDFSSDSRFLLTSSLEDSVNVWDLETREVVRRFFAGAGPAGFVSFIEDDDFVLYTIGEDNVIVRQSLAIDGLVKTVCASLQGDLNAEHRQLYRLDDSPTCHEFAES